MSMPSDGARFTGLLSDGKTAGAKPVSIRIAGGGLELRTDDDRKTRIWPYMELFSSVPVRSDAPDVLLTQRADGAETLFVNKNRPPDTSRPSEWRLRKMAFGIKEALIYYNK